MSASAWLHGPPAGRLTEGFLSILKEQRPEYLPGLLDSYREHGVFRTQGAGAVGGLLGFSNAKLASSKTRFEGLCLLAMLVQDSSCEVFQQHCLSWLRSLQQVIQSQAPVASVQLAVAVLKDLLRYSSQLAELAREVGLNCVLGILTSLLGLKAECELAAMEGMTACMTYYPRACGSLRDKLGAYFLSKMDSSDKRSQEMACRCFGRLPCLGGLTERAAGAGRAERWSDQVHCLLASANAALSDLYGGSESDRTAQYRGPGVELGFPHLDQSDALLPLQLQRRYAAACLALKHTLRADPASAVRLPVRPLLNLVCRALAVSAKSVNLTGDGSVRLLLLPAVHAGTLEVLTALVTAARSSMVPYAAVLHRLFGQTLSAWTPAPEANPGQQRAYSSVRVAVYRSLEAWVQVAGASAGVLQGSPGHSELLFAHLLADITPGAESVKLRAGLSADAVPGGKPGPRRTKPLVMADAVGSSLQRKGEALANQDTCLCALRALRQIVLSSGALLQDDLHKRLHEVLLPLCVRLQQQQQQSGCNGASESAGGVGGQYGGALARRELYRLLLALVLVPSPTWPPPLTCAVSILSKGRCDRNLKVSSFCTEALSVCNAQVHPRAPSLAMPLPPLTLKAAPSAPVPPSSQAPGLPLPTLLGGPGSSGPFPARHSLALLGSLENHPSLVPGHASGEALLSPHAQPEPASLGPPEGQRPVFVRYDKEEAEDVEISLASDSDDSVVIVPPGMLAAEACRPTETSAAPPQNLPAGEPAHAAPAAAGLSLPEELAGASASAAPLPVAPVDSFAPPAASAGSSGPPAGEGEAPAGGPQLQQMLMQPSAPVALGLPLQMQQLQNQLGHPQGRLQAGEDSTVININSTDDEDEEEDMEDDEELDEDEEEVSDFPEGEFYEGEEFDEFDEELEEEEEEDEEEEEEDEEEDDEEEEEGGQGGTMPPLEGAEDKADTGGIEEEKVLRPEAAAPPPAVDGEVVGGIQEIGLSRGEVADERARVQEVESIGVLEGPAQEEEEEEESDRMDDPTMPQILCVTGGAREEREEPAGGDDPAPARLRPPEQEAPAPSQEAGAADDQPPVLQNELLAAPPEGDGPRPAEPAALSGPHEEDVDREGQTEEEGQGDEGKGGKRKRDDADQEEGPSAEKKKMHDDTVASMLADFVDCPPDDDEVVASGSDP